MLERREPDIDYQYIKDLARFPAAAKPGDKRRIQVRWEGQIEAERGGTHTFSLYASEYARLWVDGKLLVDRWRQNWNPWHHEFALQLQPGQRHTLKVEWDLIDPSYIALLHRDPLPAAEAGNLSLWSEAGQMIDYYVVAGDNADQVIAGYRQLTGKAVLLPKWAYGFWQSRERYKTQDELLGALAEYRRRQLPIDNIVLDWSYWPENAWGSHDFDRSRFPDPDGMVKAVHASHAQLMISGLAEVLSEHRPLQGTGRGRTHLPAQRRGGRAGLDRQGLHQRVLRSVRGRRAGDLLAADRRKTQPQGHRCLVAGCRRARRAFQPGHRRAQGAHHPTALGPSTEFFNAYPLPHTHGVYAGDRAADGKRVFILSRKGYAGIQRNAVAVWSGDIASRWEDMREQISAGVNLSMSGLPNWTFDIGGFAVEKRYETQDPAHLPEWRELNTRWFQFGAFVPLFRSHGQFPYREIWNIAPEGTPYYASMAYYSRLRYALLPYIYTLAGDTYHRDGVMMRGLPMDFPHDPKVADIDDEYLFGPAFLVAPVTRFGATSRKVYLPAGTDWIDFNSGALHAGGQTIDAAAPLQRMPLFVRAGAIVPMTRVQQYVDQIPDAPLTVVVYTGADGRFSLYEDDGTGYGYEKGRVQPYPAAVGPGTGRVAHRCARRPLARHAGPAQHPRALRRRLARGCRRAGTGGGRQRGVTTASPWRCHARAAAMPPRRRADEPGMAREMARCSEICVLRPYPHPPRWDSLPRKSGHGPGGRRDEANAVRRNRARLARVLDAVHQNGACGCASTQLLQPPQPVRAWRTAPSEVRIATATRAG